MKKIKFFVFLALALWQAGVAAQTTLDDCQRAAQENYPLIRRYGLISQSASASIDQLVRRAWLPQVEGYGQGTLQSDVASLPDALTAVMSQMGYEPKGLSRGQYKVGVNVSQNLYDGGLTAARKQVIRAQSLVDEAQNNVGLYAVRQRVSDLFFGILLTDERIRQAEDLRTLLLSNENQLGKLLKGGVAMECDYNSVRAERLNSERQLTELQSTRQQLVAVLAAFTGLEVGELAKPGSSMSSWHDDTQNLRPELWLAERQLSLADAQEREIRAGLLPRVGAFAQGYYGYPGYDMFRDMLHREPTLNGLVGLKVSWNLSNFFTRKADLAKVALQRDAAVNQRDVFLFNNRLERLRQTEEVEKYRRLMAEDDEIVALRTKVRVAAESKLKHGIINVNDLLQDITRENAAKTERATHEIQWLKAAYDLKITN